jgi:hypothetical protein
MADKLQDLGEMVAGVLHDLHQSLALVTGCLELAQEALVDGQSDEVRSRLRLADRAARDATLTLNRLLANARVDAEEQRKLVDMGRMLHEMAELTGPYWLHVAGTEGRHIRLFVTASDGLLVYGWEHRLRSAARSDSLASVGAAGSDSKWPTPALAWTRWCKRAAASRSSRPRAAQRPAWAWPRCRPSSSSMAAAWRCSQRRAWGRSFG